MQNIVLNTWRRHKIWNSRFWSFWCTKN